MKFRLLLLVLINILFAKEVTVDLDSLYPNKNILKGSYDTAEVTIPVANRWNIKNLKIHLEFMPSKALTPKRSLLVVYFNGVVVFQKILDPTIDLYSYDIFIPKSLVKDFNKLEVKAIQHYCLNCCENPSSPELWTEVFWKKSYLKVKYEEKPIKDKLLYLRDYVLDYKNLGTLNFGIITQSLNDYFLTMGAKIASYLGSNIKYRKVFVNSLDSFKKDEDIFLIGDYSFIRKKLKLNLKDFPNVFLVQNPYYSNRAIVVVTAKDKEELNRVVDSLISIPRNLIIGKNLTIEKYKKPVINAYESPKYIPFNKKVYLKDLGYEDLKFYQPTYFHKIKFTVPPDIFTFSGGKWIFHMFYSYNGAVDTEASAINIFLNGKFLANLKIDKKYGTILEDNIIKIPVYLLSPGDNELEIQYALKPPGGGHCINPNYRLLQGSVFSDKSYIEIPDLLHWREMPYLELFTTEIYPYSIYPDLKDTEIFVSKKTTDIISSLYTLMAYIGEKILVPSYNVNVVSSLDALDKSKNIIAIGSNFPTVFFKNTPIGFKNNKIQLKYSAFKKIEDTIRNRLLGRKEDKNLKTILSLKDNFLDETLLVEGKSPFKSQKTILILSSKNDNNVLKTIQKFYNPVFAGKIKGDLAVIDILNNKVYSANIGKKYYVGHLPWFDFILFKIGFSLPILLLLFVVSMFGIVITLKLLLDFRERRKKIE